MKTISNFRLFKINTPDLKSIKGGIVSQEEYCYTLSMIMSCNTNTPAMAAAWGSYCSPVNSERLWHGECTS